MFSFLSGKSTKHGEDDASIFTESDIDHILKTFAIGDEHLSKPESPSLIPSRHSTGLVRLDWVLELIKERLSTSMSFT